MMRALKYLVRTLVILVGVAGIALAWFSAYEWQPESRQSVDYAHLAPDTLAEDTITIISWNIGYGGLGADMDFFYDGGEMVRDSREATVRNIEAIKNFLREHDYADIILLQEVDSTSKRNYDINLYDELTTAFADYHPYYALNYNAPYVPIPVATPIGSVTSGLLTLTRIAPASAVRYSLPAEFPYPMRLFNLKRAMLALGLRLGDGKMFYVNNIHCSAFDDGTMRADEIEFIVDMMRSQGMAATIGDWNSVPPTIASDPPSTPEFTPYKIASGVFPYNWHIACDTLAPSARFNNRPYDPATSLTTTIDFGLSTARIEPVECRVIDLGFANSDHNPVIIKYRIWSEVF